MLTKNQILLSVLAVCLAITSSPASAQLSQKSFCETYAERALAQVREAQELKCAGLTGPAWSTDQQLHFNWCLKAPRELAESETGKREAALRGCRQTSRAGGQGATATIQSISKVTPPPPATIQSISKLPPQATAGSPPTIAPLSKAEIVNTIYTIPVAAPTIPATGEQGYVQCVLMNVSPSNVKVTVTAVNTYGLVVEQYTLNVLPRHSRRLIVQAHEMPIACIFETNAPAGALRAGAVISGREGSGSIAVLPAR